MLRSGYEGRASQILIMRQRGCTFREIAFILEIRLSVVHQTWQRYRGIGRFESDQGQGGALSPQHLQARLIFVRSFIGWTERDWRNVLFAGVFRFCLNSENRAIGDSSLMVWGGIFNSGRTALVLVSPRLNARRYVDDILQPHVLPIRRRIGQKFTLMQGNGIWNDAYVTNMFLQANNINVFSLPPLSPDLQPIRNVWETIVNRLRDLPIQPANLGDLLDRLNEIWETLPQETIQNCIDMPERLSAVMANGGTYRNP